MGRRPLLSFTVCWVAGSAAACRLSGGPLLITWAGILLLLAAFAFWGRLSWKTLAVLGLSFTLAALYWEWNEGRNVSALPEAFVMESSEMEGIPVQAEGTIISTVERDGDRVDFTIKLKDMVWNEKNKQQADSETRAKVQGEKIKVQLKLEAEQEIAAAARWHRGDKVNLSGVLEQPSGARNFGGFDYRAYLLTKQVHWLLKVTGTDNVKAAAPSSWNGATILRWNDGVRAALGAEMDRLFGKSQAGYMKGLVLGIQDDLDPDTFRQFSQLGLTHILAISGMHVAVYVGVLLFILLRLRLTRETALTLVLFLVPIYVLLAGAGPSVVRAGIMVMIALFAARMGVLKDGLNILSASALLMLVWNPYFLLSVSFQLSFLVTAGLMVYVPLANHLLNNLPRWLGSALSVTWVAQMVSFPLTLYYFNQFSLLSFAANFILVPFITFVILPLGTAVLLLGQLWEGAAKMLVSLTEGLNNATFDVVEWMNGWSAGVTIWRSPSLFWIGAYYLLFYGLLYTFKKIQETRCTPPYMEDETRPLEGLHPYSRANVGGGKGQTKVSAFRSPLSFLWSRFTVSLLSLCLVILLYIGYQPENHSGAGTLSYFDVGQGDSILITTPAGSNILVDGGGTVSFGQKEEWRIRRSPFEVGAKVLVPLLKKRGIHRLDAVILTHGDQDHAGGLQAVLEGMPVSALLFNGTIADREPYLKLMRTALERNVQLYGVHQGMSVSPDKETELAFLWPELGDQDNKPEVPVLEEQNHDSVVFRLNMKGHSFLFTGDMDLAAEEEIMEMGRSRGLPPESHIDVLKAAHHGSKTSTGDSWLDYWKPSAAVISAGVNNLYGHPSGEVLDRLAADDIQIFRTDLQGEIQMKVQEGAILMRHKLE
ncbi:ComEC/Rec2 family competence protein [Paenibacillus sp. BR2-3]|uniref:ComEC/Rec2 family competence protein n=1 Tax=Paenibacillus sp. BR2-3 TaxID=3048494 RepID=UPI0039777A96